MSVVVNEFKLADLVLQGLVTVHHLMMGFESVLEIIEKVVSCLLAASVIWMTFCIIFLNNVVNLYTISTIFQITYIQQSLLMNVQFIKGLLHITKSNLIHGSNEYFHKFIIFDLSVPIQVKCFESILDVYIWNLNLELFNTGEEFLKT
jgi:hypothetical protein